MKHTLSFFFCFSILFCFAQRNYSTAIGIKGGYPSYGSFNIKHRLNGIQAIEGSIGGSAIGNGIIIEGLYEFNNPLKENGLEWYYGGGVILGFIKTVEGSNWEEKNYLLSGIKSVIGIEYTFEDFPLNIAIDTGPIVVITPSFSFTWAGSLSIRYCIFN